MRAPILLLGAISTAAAAEPGVFDDYFDDQLRSVDIPQESVLKACLTNGDATGKKIQTAYDGCFGTDYDFNDLAENDEGKDSDGDDLPDEYEANEACFYSAMGWVSADGKDVSVDTLEADMAGLEEAVAKDFKANAKSCSKWSGDFGGGRRKREAGEEEVVPDLMVSGRRSLGWVKSVARKTRSAEKGEGKKTGKGKGKKGKGKGGNGTGRKNKGKKGNGGNGTGRNNKGGKVKKGGNGTGKNNKGGKVKKGKGGNRTGKQNKGAKGKKGKGGNGTPNTNNGGKVNKGKGNNGTGRKNGKGKNKKDNGRKKTENKGKGNKGDKEKDKSGKGGKKGTKKGGDKKRNGKGDKEKQMDEKIYNKLWCFDLAVEQALEKCVEDKIKN